MEYDGGTTTGQPALQHETYHSWWGRGLKPASQPDAWLDEGWAFYQVDTGPVSVPFDFAPTASVIVRARWPKALVPPAGTHSCLLASVFSRSNHPLSNKHVWEQNSLAQKNLTIIAAQPDTWVVLPFVVANRWASASLKYTLELVRMKKDAALKAELIYIRSLDTSRNALKKRTRPVPEPDIREVEEVLARRQADEAKTITDRIRHEIITSSNPENLDLLFPAYKVQPFPLKRDARISLILAPQQHRLLGLRIYVPRAAKKGDVIHVNLVKRSVRTKKVMGGIALTVHVT